MLPVKLYGQFLIRLVTSHNIQHCQIVSTLFLVHNERPVCRSKQPICAGNHIKAVLGFQLACVMNHQQADTIFIAE